MEKVVTRESKTTGNGKARGKRPVPLELLATAILLPLLFLLQPACRPSPSSLTTVSGKTLFRELGPAAGMALEDVTIEVLRWKEGKWQPHVKTRSGYHGSFVVYLPAGKYLFVARTTLQRSSGDSELAGRLEGLTVSSTDRRLDQLVIEMRQAMD